MSDDGQQVEARASGASACSPAGSSARRDFRNTGNLGAQSIKGVALIAASILALWTARAVADERATRLNEVPGWGRVTDPWGDCDVSFNSEYERLKIEVPGTPHVLSVEVPQLPMNAPRIARRIGGDFTASVHVLGTFEPGRSKTTHYNPYHGAGLIVWQDASNYLRLEQAVGFVNGRNLPYINYELRQHGLLAVSRGIPIADRPLFLKLRRQGATFAAWGSRDGRQWVALGTVEVKFAARVDVGVVAVNSSGRTLSAELEGLRIDDPDGSLARDYLDDEPEGPSQRPPVPREDAPVRPRPTSLLTEPDLGVSRLPGIRRQ
jgi:regulation of enolase protein 1 (concanavalin A-like superfamily)